MLDCNQIDAEHLSRIDFLHGFFCDLLCHAQFHQVNLFAQRDKVQKARSKQPICQTNRHIPFRINDFCPQQFQHTALFCTGCLGNDPLHTQLNNIQRCQDAGVYPFSDADDDHITVINSDFSEILLRKLLHHIGVVGKRCRRIDFCFVFINDNQIFSGFRKGLCQCIAKPSQSDNSIQSVFCFHFFSKHNGSPFFCLMFSVSPLLPLSNRNAFHWQQNGLPMFPEPERNHS